MGEMKIQIPKNIDWSKRTEIKENMEVMSFSDDEMQSILENIAWVNRWFGGDEISLKAVKKRKKSLGKASICVIDVGCGGGAMCRKLAKVLGPEDRIIGIDIDPQTLRLAEEKSVDFPQISYRQMDVFQEDLRQLHPDIILSTLTVHHFTDKEIAQFLANCMKVPKVTLVINDLHRSPLGFFAFRIIGKLFNLHKCNQIDGLLSILRAFKREELDAYTKPLIENKAGVKHEVYWKWAFRYLWIIKNI